jgi:hypothetical protein
MLVLGEQENCAFVLNPVEQGCEYRISIGDIPIKDIVPNESDADGIAMLGQLIWREWPYFESARGKTRVLLQKKSDTDAWDLVLEFAVWVNPTKIGEESYQIMADDLQKVSRSLLVDLYGKSNRASEIRFANEMRSFHSWEEELESMSLVVERLGTLLYYIQQRPSSHVERHLEKTKYWGTGSLRPMSVVSLLRQGVDAKRSIRPITILQCRLKESFDIPEHRVLKAFLGILEKRSDLCAEAAKKHINAINNDKHLRNIRIGDHVSIYEIIDIPKIKRLRDASKKAANLSALVQAMANHPFLSNIKPELTCTTGGMFQRSQEYRALLHVIRGFLVENAVWYEGNQFTAVTKLTSRLFEQWCFLQIVDAFRSVGLDLQEWNDTLRQSLRSRFILDFDRGLQFEGLLTSGVKVRFRYEPWILGQNAAERAGETLCRVSHDNVAWSPDIVIEFLKPKDDFWESVYVIVIDCKYTARIREHHWNDTSKYLQIRSSHSRRQVVRQLWLMSPNSKEEIVATDPAIIFNDDGPSCPFDEAVTFNLKVNPRGTEPVDFAPTNESIINKFAAGTINFVRRELI